MKVLIVTGLFYPSKLGGPANTLYWLSKELVKNGIDVTVSATDHYVDPNRIVKNKWTIIDGIKVCYSTKNSPFGFRQLHKLRSVLKNTDIVLLSSICYIPNFFAFLAAKYYKKPIVWSPRGEVFETAIEGSTLKIQYFKIINRLLPVSMAFHATSVQEKQAILNVFTLAKQVLVIPNLFELPVSVERSEIDAPFFIYVGRINPIKALDNLLLGLAQSNFKGSGYLLKIVGPDQNNYKAFLTDLAEKLGIENQLVFIDGLYGEEKYKAYAQADFSFLVSHSENFGNVVIESLSQGTPVVASKGTPWELLEQNNAGFWIDNTPNSIADCVNVLLSMDRRELENMRHSAKQLSYRFDVSKRINDWVSFFNNICTSDNYL